MKRNTRGFYTVEASVCLPVVILAVLALGYFMRIEGLWENCIHGSVDESGLAAAGAESGIEKTMLAARVKQRIEKDNPQLDSIHIRDVRIGYSDIYEDELMSYRLNAKEGVAFPLGLKWEPELDTKIRFRGFVGKKTRGSPMGADGLEADQAGDPVWIFPQSGEKYHKEECTYVKANIHSEILTDGLRDRYKSCGLCKSGELPSGSIVFCFGSGDTSYHRGTCRSIDRRTVVIDRSEAEKKGYGRCSKCGG